MLFMVIERFRDNDMLPIYNRGRDEGRSPAAVLTLIFFALLTTWLFVIT